MTKVIEAYIDTIDDNGNDRYIVKLGREKEWVMVNGLIGWSYLDSYLLEYPETLDKLFDSWKKLALENTPRYFYFSIVE